MLYFESDYTEGAHPELFRRLIEVNTEHLAGYGSDVYCESARQKIKEACGCPDAEVYFLVGGTQTNKTVISTTLRAYEGVIAAESGHIATHEAGAIETSHKILTLPQKEGKIIPDTLEKYLELFFSDENRYHMVSPGMVYVSHPTEYGTLYTRGELEKISEICHRYELPLYLDGARLGYGLMSYTSDMTLADIAALCDIFYIGGTKVGALCGEAVVFTKNNAPRQFITLVKQHGALLAKGFVLGVQFDTLFTDGLYFKISRHAIDMAQKMREIFAHKGYEFYIETSTNQIFITLEDKQMEKLSKKVAFSFWERIDDSRCVVRFATSWATNEADVDALNEVL